MTSDTLAGSRGEKGYAYPGSSGLRPSDTRAMNNAPLPGCFRDGLADPFLHQIQIIERA